MKNKAPCHALAALLLAVILPLAVHAGTPLICHPYAIGDAPCLPGGGWKGASPRYDRTHLVPDTLALLTPETPVLVRMETLRRAAIYASANLRGWAKNTSYSVDDRKFASALLDQLRDRTTKTAGETRVLALFDLGFFAETLRQTKLDPALDGYALLVKVAELRPNDADVQFALALASSYPDRKADHSQHVQQARNGAKAGSLLAANLQSHFPR
jgi:hypothetical protein